MGVVQIASAARDVICDEIHHHPDNVRLVASSRFFLHGQLHKDFLLSSSLRNQVDRLLVRSPYPWRLHGLRRATKKKKNVAFSQQAGLINKHPCLNSVLRHRFSYSSDWPNIKRSVLNPQTNKHDRIYSEFLVASAAYISHPQAHISLGRDQ